MYSGVYTDACGMGSLYTSGMRRASNVSVAWCQVASPATVSRCGMIFMEPHTLGWQPLFTSWMNTLPETLTAAHRKFIKTLFDRSVNALLQFVGHKNFRNLTNAGDLNRVTSCMNMMSALMDEFRDPKAFEALDDEQVGGDTP